jgi:hypothetical protein
MEAEEETIEIIHADEDDPIIPKIKTFVQRFKDVETTSEDLVKELMTRYSFLSVYDNSIAQVKGLLFTGLSTQERNYMLLADKYKGKWLNKMTSAEQEAISTARIESIKIDKFLHRMFLYLRKFYGNCTLL